MAGGLGTVAAGFQRGKQSVGAVRQPIPMPTPQCDMKQFLMIAPARLVSRGSNCMSVAVRRQFRKELETLKALLEARG